MPLLGLEIPRVEESLEKMANKMKIQPGRSKR